MDILFRKSFYKDLNKIKDAKVASEIISIVDQIKISKELSSLTGIKKMKGSKTAYRIRIGDYRLGIYKIERDTIELSRILHRKDIYKFFP